MKVFTRIDNSSAKQTWKIYLEEIRRDKKGVLFFAVVVPISQFLRYVFMPLMMSFIVQALITNPKDTNTLLGLIAIMAVAALISIVLNNRGLTWLFNNEEIVNTQLTMRAMNHLMSQSYEFFSNRKVGALSGDVMGFAKSYQGVMDALWQASGLAVSYITSLIIIGFMSPLLLIPLLLLTFGVLILSIRSLNVRAPFRNERKRRTSELSGLIADVLGNQILVKVFAREYQETHYLVKKRETIQQLAHTEIDIIERESIFRQVLLSIFQTTALLIGIWLYGQNAVSIAALVFIITYLGRITDTMFGITTIIRAVEQALLDAAPITKILQEAPEVIDVPNAQTLTVPHGALSFDNVSFRYNDTPTEPVFTDLNLTIPAKQRIGLAGYSGGGKTTLTKLLLRFVDVSTGSITIDGQDISQVTQESLRDAIAYVPQEPFLFHRSLRDNIAYGKPAASDEEITEAATKAHAMEFINKLPEGLDTIVGERGVKLSGGQRQRIAIARAILKDAPMLVLDEATSALDSESEKLIQSSISELMENKTAIVIAHRLSTIARLDRIIVIDDGKIVEDGTHTKLIANNKIYAKLWQHQSDGFIDG